MSDPKKKEFHYGGQAIIEGVMMRGPKDFGVAVRRVNGEIVTTKEDVESILGKFKWLNRPFLRGTLALIDSMVLGIKALMYSADIAMKDISAAEGQAKSGTSEAAFEDNPNVAAPPLDAPSEPESKSSGINDLTISVMMVVGLALGLALFFFVPILIVKPLKTAYALPRWQLTSIEGIIKITMFVVYILAISLMKDVRRVFQYHGAEHKTINAYEAKEELTVDNVSRYSKVHVRCGTSFILVVLFTSIIVFMAVPWNNILQRFLYKLLLLPVIAGIAYEVIRFAGRFKDSIATKLLTFPGLLMQKITTREPEPDMIEVAIKSLECVLEREAQREATSPS
ncbi:MAG: DUF1385 domain-containing protein [Armatimonadetes bacterium]|nr:DUF1385 domain-containing protein [Armatimonadota bacterium]